MTAQLRLTEKQARRLGIKIESRGRAGNGAGARVKAGAASKAAPSVPLREKDIQRTICDLLKADGWRVFQFEQQWSEKKRKTVGEKGMPDVLAIRYNALSGMTETDEEEWDGDITLWLELKRTIRGRATKASTAQLLWHQAERARGALTWIAGVDFPATIEGFQEHYARSGLQRR